MLGGGTGVWIYNHLLCLQKESMYYLNVSYERTLLGSEGEGSFTFILCTTVLFELYKQ
jgi:hypothetical protein